ncbi:recombinase family protein [Streptomyces antimycoticus]|uniref:recombinase family protein n=1 Tax=Streptomyces antimycoticus TaxID=68175 RepID=UPI0033CA04B9
MPSRARSRREPAPRPPERARQLRDEDGLSLREIVAALEAEGIRPKRGERWHPETVRRMLAQETPYTLRHR